MNQYHGQFILHQNQESLCKGWNVYYLDQTWTLETHPALPVTPIETYTGELFGYFLGYPITPKFQYLRAKAIVPGGTHYEDWLYSWGGRWCAVIQMPGSQPRLHLDAIGSLGCVYSPGDNIVASSPALIPRYLMLAPEPFEGVFLPAGLTPYPYVKRLLPNHYLDLDTMIPVRHWPLQNFKPVRRAIQCFKNQTTTEQLIAEIAERLQQNISAVVRKHEAYMSLTAGQDSRMLLAAARAVLDRVRWFTYEESIETIDMYLASKLARQFDLDWSLLWKGWPCPYDTSDWQRDVGYCVSGAIADHAPRFANLSSTRVRMTGLAGEIGRAYYWRSNERSVCPRPPDLLARMKCPATHESVMAMDTWLQSVPDWMNAYELLDLAYIEHRLGCWAGPSLYGSDQYFAGQLVPLGDRYIIERMLSLSLRYRKDQRMARDVIGYLWPELLDLPFNRYTGRKRFTTKIGLRTEAKRVKRFFNRLKVCS